MIIVGASGYGVVLSLDPDRVFVDGYILRNIVLLGF